MINSGFVLGLVGAHSGALMATLAYLLSRAPGWGELRSFAFIAVAATAYCLFDLVHFVPVSARTLQIGEGLALSSAFLYGLAWVRHLAISDRGSIRIMERGALVIAPVMVVLALIPGVLVAPPIRSVHVEWFGTTFTMATATPLGLACVALMLSAVLVAAFGGGRRWNDGWHARLPMVGATALVLTGVSDTLAFMEMISMPQLIGPATIVVVGVIGVSHARRFIADARRLDALSTKLEHEVAARTTELLEVQAIAAHNERLAGLGRIAAGVAHEINNPTMVIQQNLDRLRTLIEDNERLTPEMDARLQRSRAATQHIAQIARQLLEAGRPPPTDNANAAAFSLALVVARAVTAASVRAPTLVVTISVAESLCARGVPTFLEQALVNLLVNAAHATSDTPGGGRARVEGVRRGDHVHLSVTDNGPGIPATVQARLFEPFTTTKPIGQGTGLGLAVSRGLMTQQGGALYLARSTSEGTEMTLELPAADAPDAPPATTTIELPAAEPAEGRDVRVLLIDDNDDIRELLVLQLDRFFRVDSVPTVEQACSMVTSGPPYDVVICDLMMPSGGGESWLAQCNEFDPRLAERTILLTAGPTTDATRKLVEERREMTMFKPIDIAELRPLIERVGRREATKGSASMRTDPSST